MHRSTDPAIYLPSHEATDLLIWRFTDLFSYRSPDLAIHRFLDLRWIGGSVKDKLLDRLISEWVDL